MILLIQPKKKDEYISSPEFLNKKAVNHVFLSLNDAFVNRFVAVKTNCPMCFSLLR